MAKAPKAGVRDVAGSPLPVTRPLKSLPLAGRMAGASAPSQAASRVPCPVASSLFHLQQPGLAKAGARETLHRAGLLGHPLPGAGDPRPGALFGGERLLRCSQHHRCALVGSEAQPRALGLPRVSWHLPTTLELPGWVCDPVFFYPSTERGRLCLHLLPNSHPVLLDVQTRSPPLPINQMRLNQHLCNRI